MPYIPERATKGKDASHTLGACSQCLGDLEYRTADDEGHYVCMQCGVRRQLAAAVVRPAEAPYPEQTVAPDVLLNRVSS